MEDNKIVIKAMHDSESFLRLNRFLMLRTKRAFAFWMAPALFLFFGILCLVMGEFVFGFVFIALSPALIGLMLFLNRMLAKLLLKSSKFYTETRIITYELDEEGMVYKTNNTSLAVKWQDIYLVYESTYSFYLKQDTVQSYILDKKYMTEYQANKLREFLKNKIEVKKYKDKTNKHKPVKYLDENTELNFKEEIIENEKQISEVNYDVTLTATMTLEEFLKFNYFHLFKGTNKLIVIFFPIIFLILGFLSYLEGNLEETIVLTLFVILMPPLMIIFTRISVKKNFKSNKFIQSITDVFYGFNSDGITQISKVSRSEFKWTQVFRVYEQKEFFFIYLSRMQALIIPKAALGEGGVGRLRLLMNNTLAKKQNKLKN